MAKKGTIPALKTPLFTALNSGYDPLKHRVRSTGLIRQVVECGPGKTGLCTEIASWKKREGGNRQTGWQADGLRQTELILRVGESTNFSRRTTHPLNRGMWPGSPGWRGQEAGPPACRRTSQRSSNTRRPGFNALIVHLAYLWEAINNYELLSEVNPILCDLFFP